MKKTKKSLFVIFALLTVAMLSSCASTGGHFINDDLLVEPDPDNPFQGTWVTTGSARTASTYYMHVIEGMSGTWYYRASYTGWIKSAVYMIEATDDGKYMTSNNWRIRADNEILTVENMTYERYKW